MSNTSIARSAARTVGWRVHTEVLSLPAILGFSLLSLAWLLPGHYLPWTMFQQEALAAAAGLLLCWAALEKTRAAIWPLSAQVAVAAAAIPWLQYGAHQIRFLTDALLSSSYLMALAMAIASSATLAAGKRRGQLLDGWTASCVAAALLSVGMALYQWLQLPSPGDWLAQVMPGGRVFANLAQPNHLSSLLALGVAGVLRWYETRRVGPAVAILAVASLGWGIAMTESRTGWIFVGILSLGTLAMRRRAHLRTPVAAILAGALAFAATVSAQGSLHDRWTQPPEASASMLRTAVGTRSVHWQSLGESALQAPWFGYGWNQVAQAQFEVAERYPATGEAQMYSHNLLLDLVLYNGVPLGLLIFAGLAWYVAKLLRASRDADSWCLALALLALLAHALLEYPLHYLYFLIPAGLLMGALDQMTRPSASPRREAPKATLWLPALLMAGLLVWVGIEYMRAEEALRRLRFATARIGITMVDLRSPDLLLLDGWKSYHDASMLQARPGMPGVELSLLSDTARRFPYPAALYREAHALALNQQPVAAQRTLRYICKVYPALVTSSLREAWQERQASEPVLRNVEFPTCAD